MGNSFLETSCNIIQRANELQAKARVVLQKTGIQSVWNKVGKTYLVGSMRFGLMASPNIDLETYVEKPDPRDGFDVMREIASLPGITQVSYFNYLSTEDPGLYWWFEYVDEDGVAWDFDNWLIPFSHPNAGMADAFAAAMSAKLTPEARETILKIKLTAKKSDIVEKPRGIDIYKAVLRDGISTFDAFKTWLEANPAVPMETWCPE